MYNLKPNGRISKNFKLTKNMHWMQSPDVNFSIWNVDLNYVWQFAPGSFLTVLYTDNNCFKTMICCNLGFSNSLDNLFNQNFQHTLVGMRLQYFIDVDDVKNKVFGNSIL